MGDLDGSTRPVGHKWQATVLVAVHDNAELSVANAVVNGNWSGGYSGSGSCVTDSSGFCSMTTNSIPNGQGTVTFTVEGISLAGYAYEPAENHDADGDSDGSVIVVTSN